MAVGATAVWRVRPSGSNTNGGGYDSGLAGAATDYSQRDTPIANGTNGVTTGTTNFADTTANAFTSAMVGNAIYITGTGQTTGFYFVTAFVDVGNVTLDRSPGTGTGATWNLGGGWADFWTNCGASGPLVILNTVYILGSGTPNPASYTYDYTISNTKTLISGDATNGSLTFANDPATPGYKAPPDTTGGMPTVLLNNAGANISGGNYVNWNGIWFVTGASNLGGMFTSNPFYAFGSVWDQNAKDSIMFYATEKILKGCEWFSSTTGSIGTYGFMFSGTTIAYDCNFHDLTIPFSYLAPLELYNCIIAKNKKSTNGNSAIMINGGQVRLYNCTIDGNEGHAISISAPALITTNGSRIINCIISNHTDVGAYGIIVVTGSNSVGYAAIDYNVFYNNTANLSGIKPGAHDTTGISDPYVAQSTENYTLK